MCTTCAAHHLEPARTWDEFLDRLGSWREQRGLSFEALDNLAGVAKSYSGQIPSPARRKPLTPMMMELLLQILGIQLLVVEDPAAVANIVHRWGPRTETHVRTSGQVSQKLLNRARPFILQELITAAAAAAARPPNQALKWEPAPCR
jgi:hypothetical protein